MAKSLIDCIRLHGKAVNRDDAEAIRAIAAEYGIGHDSEVKATLEFIHRINAEREALLNQIEAAGGSRAEWDDFLVEDEVTLNDSLNETGREIESEVMELLTGQSWFKIKEIYDSISKANGWVEDTFGGKILSVDAMREIYDKYRKNRLIADATHEPFSAALKKLFRERLAEPVVGDEHWLFMAGGPSVGKSSSLGLSEWSEDADLIYDGTLSNFRKDDATKIGKALETGRKVGIMYVYRNPEEAFEGALIRAQGMKNKSGSGRVVGVDTFIGGTVGSNVAIREFYNKYKNDDRVSFEFFRTETFLTDKGKTAIRSVPIEFSEIPRLSRADLTARIRAAAEEAKATGEIDEEIYNYTVNQPLRKGLSAGGEVDEQEAAGALRVPEETLSEADTDTGGSRAAFSRTEPRPVTPEIRKKHAQMRLGLAKAIRQLSGTLDVQLLMTADEIPEGARPADDPSGNTVEGLWLRGTDEAFLVAENIESIQRAQDVLAHEAFGHYAMERLPEFDEILTTVQNLKAIGNKTVSEAAARVAATQGTLDPTTEAKEIIAVMVESGIRSSTIDRAVAAARRVLRRLGLNLQMGEAEVRSLIVEAARGLQSQARAKQAALANMPTEAQILQDPAAVESSIRNAIEEIYAGQTLQDMVLSLHSELEAISTSDDPAQQARASQLRQALYDAGTSPRVSPEVMYARAYHGTGAPEFDRFDIKYIGTGEGAQAYGYGLYFSTSRAVAEWYQKALGRMTKRYTFNDENIDFDELEAKVNNEIWDVVEPIFKESGQQFGTLDIEGLVDGISGVSTSFARQVHLSNRLISTIEEEIEDQITSYKHHLSGAKEAAKNPDPVVAKANKETVVRATAAIAAWEQVKKLWPKIGVVADSGNLMEVEVPEDDDLLDYQKPIALHSQKIQDKIKAKFPELFEEQWVRAKQGDPVLSDLVDQKMINKNIKEKGKGWMWEQGFMLGKPADLMRGEYFYEYVGEKVLNEKQTIVDKLLPGFGGAVGQQARDRLASAYIRDELGIPGHTFVGHTSSEKNYVIYDDSAVMITAVNDVKRPIRSEESRQAIEQAGEVAEALFSRNIGKKPCGKCFENSGRWMLNNTVPGARLVHGYVTGQGPIEGVRYAHSWIEVPGQPIEDSQGVLSREDTDYFSREAIDVTTDERYQNPVRLSAALYRAIAQADVQAEYTREQALDLMTEHSHWGPWEFEETAEAEAVARGEDPYSNEPMYSRRDRVYQADLVERSYDEIAAEMDQVLQGREVRELLPEESGRLEELRAQLPGFGEQRAVAKQRLGRGERLFSRRVRGDNDIEAIRARVMATAGEDITVRDRIRDAVRRMVGVDWLDVKQGLVDSAASVEALEKRIYDGELQDASISPYKAVLATKNIGSVMAAVMHRGIPILRNGVFQPRRGRKGFVEIFTPITQHADGNLLPLWELYAVAKRADRLIGEKNKDGTSKEKLLTREEINKALALEAQYPEFKTAFDEWNVFNSQALDLAIKTGVINAAEAAVWRKNDYVPFYRAMEDVEFGGEGQGPRNRGTGVEGVRPRIRRLTGSEKPLGNVFENMIMNTAYLVDASFRNDAMQRLVLMADGIAMEKVPMAWEAVKIRDGDMARALMRAGLIVGNGVTESDMLNDGIRQVRAMTAEQKEHWSKVFRRVAPVGDDIVSVMINGKPVYYRVDDPLLLRTVTGMGARQWGGIMGLFRFSKKLLTSAVTIDPAFMMANFIRDTLSSWVVADTGKAVPPILQAIRGAKAAFAEDDDTLAIMMAGAGGGGFYDHNPAEVRKMLAKKMPKGKLDSFTNSIVTPRGLWRLWQKIGNAAEQANRVAKYRQVIAAGGTPAEAAYQARDILNFSMSGDWAAMKFLTQTVPFLNARVQGLYRLYRGGKENPIGFAYKGGAIMAATIALLLRNMDNEEYEELPEWDKDTYWHLFVGGEHFRLPKPFEIGAMYATVPERLIRAMAGRDDWDLFGKRLWSMTTETLQFNPVPQLLRPGIEQYANRNMFTGDPIVGFSLEGLAPEAQYDHWTSETMREWAKAMPDIAPEFLRSPKRLEAIVRGYTGAVGMYVLGISDSAVRRVAGHPDRPSRAIQDLPVITRFWRNPQPRTSKYTSELYDMLKEADELYRTLNAYKSQQRIGDMQELLEGNEGKLAVRKRLHKVATKVREINRQMKIVSYSNASPEAKKKAMNELNAAKLAAVRDVAYFAELF